MVLVIFTVSGIYLPYFNRIGLSPITIPEKSLHDFYPNPYKYMAGLSDTYLKSSDIMLRKDTAVSHDMIYLSDEH